MAAAADFFLVTHTSIAIIVQSSSWEARLPCGRLEDSNDVKVIGLALTAIGTGTTAIGMLFWRKKWLRVSSSNHPRCYDVDDHFELVLPRCFTINHLSCSRLLIRDVIL